MSFIAWIVLGLIAGFIGSKVVNKSGEGFFWTLCWALSARWWVGIYSKRLAWRVSAA